MRIYELFTIVIVLLVTLTLNISSVVFASGRINEIEPDKILKKVEDVYKNLSTYYDEGKSFTNHSEIEFTTYFKSNNLFFIEWTEHDQLNNSNYYYWICVNEKGIFSFKNISKTKRNTIVKHENIKKAFINYMGISNGILGIIPGLFFNDLGFRPIISLENPKILKNDNINGEECFHLTVEHIRTNTNYHIWISKKSYLIKKVKKEKIDWETTYILHKAVKNVDLNESIFNKGRRNQREPE